jgi:hypothetical protein
MTRFQKALFSFLSVIACSLLILFIWLWQGKWQQPLGPALQISTATPFGMPATWTPETAMIGDWQVIPTIVPVWQATPVPTQTMGTGLCALIVMTILAIGADTRRQLQLWTVRYSPCAINLSLKHDLWWKF